MSPFVAYFALLLSGSISLLSTRNAFITLLLLDYYGDNGWIITLITSIITYQCYHDGCYYFIITYYYSPIITYYYDNNEFIITYYY